MGFNMRKVLFAVDDIGISGIISVTNNLVTQLIQRKEYEVDILCLSISDRTKMVNNVKVHNLDINKCGRKKRYFKILPKLISFFKKNKYDSLVVCGMEFAPFYCLATANIKNMNRIAWEHRNFYDVPKYRLEWFGKRIACKFFDSVVCLTKKDYNNYLENFPKSNNIYHIYNIINIEDKSVVYNENSRQIMSAGFFGYIKGYDMLVEVAKIIFKNNSDWKWNIYGKGDCFNEIKKSLKDNELENNVVLKGHVDDIASAYSDSSIYVMTSRSEGLPSVLVEAQKHLLPIVSFDINCGPSDIIVEGINGYLINPFDIVKMAEKIEYLINNKDKRIEMSRNTRINHFQYDIEQIIEQWKNIL